MNICVFGSPGHTAGREFAGSYGNSVYNSLKNCQNIFHGGCTVPRPHHRCRRVRGALHPASVRFCRSEDSRPGGCGAAPRCGLTRAALATDGVRPLFLCLLVVCSPCLGKACSDPSPTLKPGCLFLLLVCRRSLNDPDAGGALPFLVCDLPFSPVLRRVLSFP